MKSKSFLKTTSSVFSGLGALALLSACPAPGKIEVSYQGSAAVQPVTQTDPVDQSTFTAYLTEFPGVVVNDNPSNFQSHLFTFKNTGGRNVSSFTVLTQTGDTLSKSEEDSTVTFSPSLEGLFFEYLNGFEERLAHLRNRMPEDAKDLDPSFTLSGLENCPATLKPNRSCALSIRFKPVAIGTLAGGKVQVSAQSPEYLSVIELSGTGVAPLPGRLEVTASSGAATATPILHDGKPAYRVQFPTTIIDVAATHTFQVRNIGESIANGIQIQDQDGDFSVLSTTCGTSLGINASCSLVVRYLPSAVGSAQALFNISSGDGSDMSYLELSGSGRERTTGKLLVTAGTGEANVQIGTFEGQPSLQASFASRFIGLAGITHSFSVKNTGELAATQLQFVGESPDFTFTNNTCGSSLAADAVCTFSIKYTPVTAGAVNANFTISSGDATDLSYLQLSGTGVVPHLPELTVTPSSGGSGTVTPTVTEGVTVFNLDFGDTPLGSGKSKGFTLENLGDIASLNGLTVGTQLANGFSISSNTCGSSISARGSCVVTISFNPTTQGQTPDGNSVALSASGDSRPGIRFRIVPTGRGTQPNLVLDAQDPDVTGPYSALQAFGNVEVGEQSLVKTFSITNTGNGAAPGFNLTQSGDPDFISSTNCGSSIASGATCTVSLQFKPEVGGSLSATVRLTATGTTPVVIQATGFGTIVEFGVEKVSGAGTLTSPEIDFSIHDFGKVEVGEVAQAVLRVRNIGSVTANGVTITSNKANIFEVVVPPSCQTLAAGQSCEITAKFTPAVHLQNYTSGVTISASNVTFPYQLDFKGNGFDTIHSLTMSAGQRIPSGSVITTNIGLKSGTIDFRNVEMGASITQQIIVKNNGTVRATEILVTHVSDSAFDAANHCGDLEPGQTCIIDIIFSPTGTGPTPVTQPSAPYIGLFDISSEETADDPLTIDAQGKGFNPYGTNPFTGADSFNCTVSAFNSMKSLINGNLSHFAFDKKTFDYLRVLNVKLIDTCEDLPAIKRECFNLPANFGDSDFDFESTVPITLDVKSDLLYGKISEYQALVLSKNGEKRSSQVETLYQEIAQLLIDPSLRPHATQRDRSTKKIKGTYSGSRTSLEGALVSMGIDSYWENFPSQPDLALWYSQIFDVNAFTQSVNCAINAIQDPGLISVTEVTGGDADVTPSTQNGNSILITDFGQVEVNGTVTQQFKVKNISSHSSAFDLAINAIDPNDFKNTSGKVKSIAATLDNSAALRNLQHSFSRHRLEIESYAEKSGNMPVLMHDNGSKGALDSAYEWSDNCPATLGSLDDCFITVTFTPDSAQPIFGGWIEIYSGAGNEDYTLIELDGTGVLPAVPDIRLAAGFYTNATTTITNSGRSMTINYGTIDVGDSVIQDFKVQNIGTGTAYGLDVEKVFKKALKGTGTFTLDDSDCPTNLSAGSFCYVDVTFTPFEDTLDGDPYHGGIDVTESTNQTLEIDLYGDGYEESIDYPEDIDAALAVCDEIAGDTLYNNCVDIVLTSPYPYFNGQAINMCKTAAVSITSFTDQNIRDCIFNIADVHHDPFEIPLCNSLSSGTGLLSCSAVIGRYKSLPPVDSYDYGYFYSTYFGVQDGRQNAGYGCGSYSFSDNKLECIGYVSPSDHIDDRALSLCQGMSDEDSLTCLEIIRNQYYNGDDLEFCGNEAFVEDQLDCLYFSGTKSWGKVRYPKAEIRKLKQTNFKAFMKLKTQKDLDLLRRNKERQMQKKISRFR